MILTPPQRVRSTMPKLEMILADLSNVGAGQTRRCHVLTNLIKKPMSFTKESFCEVWENLDQQ